MRKVAAFGVLVVALALSLVGSLEHREELRFWGLLVASGGSAATLVLHQTARQRGKEPIPKATIRRGSERPWRRRDSV